MKSDERIKEILQHAGEAKPSMLRRADFNDYRSRRMYMVTITTEGRRPLLGRVVGRGDAPAGSADTPRIELSPLGEAVKEAWQSITLFYPEVMVVAHQLMPDHIHGILFFKTATDYHLGQVVNGFKIGCNKAARSLLPNLFPASLAQPPFVSGSFAQPPSSLSQKEKGMLWSHGYNDRILYSADQLQRWKDYLTDNPRRLVVKREHPDFFVVQRNLSIKGMTFSAIGNRFLADYPWLLQVRCSRRMTASDIEAAKTSFLAAAREGAVLVSPSISPGEKSVMRAAFDAGYPLVLLQENGFTDLAKPGGKRFDACAAGRLLILAPWEHHNEKRTSSRGECQLLNEMAHLLCA